MALCHICNVELMPHEVQRDAQSKWKPCFECFQAANEEVKEKANHTIEQLEAFEPNLVGFQFDKDTMYLEGEGLVTMERWNERRDEW